MDKFYRDTVIEIDLDRILENINEIKEQCSKDKFFYVVVKGEGYGHGIKAIADVVAESNADGVGVATLDEALFIRKYHPEMKIICLGNVTDKHLDIINEQDITITIANENYAEKVAKQKFDKVQNVHLKINSGMNRIGFNDIDRVNKVIDLLSTNPMVNIEGIYTHFATAEGYDQEEYLMQQVDFFKNFVSHIDYPFEQIHCTNSGSLLKLHDQLDFTTANRSGIAIFGGLQDPIQDKYNIKSAFVLKSRISQVEHYPKGTGIGYCLTYHTLKDEEIIATIPLGYADGFFRNLTNTLVKSNGQYGKIVGNICMDQMMIRFDKPVNINDEVILIDSDDENISISTRANQAHTLTHEIFTSFTKRIPKLYYRNKELVAIHNPLDIQ